MSDEKVLNFPAHLISGNGPKEIMVYFIDKLLAPVHVNPGMRFEGFISALPNRIVVTYHEPNDNIAGIVDQRGANYTLISHHAEIPSDGKIFSGDFIGLDLKEDRLDPTHNFARVTAIKPMTLEGYVGVHRKHASILNGRNERIVEVEKEAETTFIKIHADLEHRGSISAYKTMVRYGCAEFLKEDILQLMSRYGAYSKKLGREVERAVQEEKAKMGPEPSLVDMLRTA